MQDQRRRGKKGMWVDVQRKLRAKRPGIRWSDNGREKNTSLLKFHVKSRLSDERSILID
jgi:hypothetical protein